MLYFIKGDSPKNWGAMKLKLTKGASPSVVIAGMEKDGWKCVTVSVFNAWRKQNSRPTLHAPNAAGAAAKVRQTNPKPTNARREKP